MDNQEDSTAGAQLIARAEFILGGETPPAIVYGEIAIYQDRLWLVSNWFESNDTGARTPAQLIPLDQFEPFPDGNRRFRLAIAVPKILLISPIPPEIQREYGVVDVPVLVHIPGPKSIH
jgi:hypothetical protein